MADQFEAYEILQKRLFKAEEDIALLKDLVDQVAKMALKLILEKDKQ